MAQSIFKKIGSFNRLRGVAGAQDQAAQDAAASKAELRNEKNELQLQLGDPLTPSVRANINARIKEIERALGEDAANESPEEAKIIKKLRELHAKKVEAPPIEKNYWERQIKKTEEELAAAREKRIQGNDASAEQVEEWMSQNQEHSSNVIELAEKALRAFGGDPRSREVMMRYLAIAKKVRYRDGRDAAEIVPARHVHSINGN